MLFLESRNEGLEILNQMSEKERQEALDDCCGETRYLLSDNFEGDMWRTFGFTGLFAACVYVILYLFVY